MVFMVMSLVFCSYVPFLYFYNDGSAVGSLAVFVFHVLLGLLVVAYFQTVLTDPGTVPPEWHANVAKLADPPYPKCRRSGIFKPPRSHFDSVTRRLVLNMDHFCPWVNNCVGFFNRRFFIQFVAYTGIAATYVALSLGYLMYTGQAIASRHHKRLTRLDADGHLQFIENKDPDISPSSTAIPHRDHFNPFGASPASIGVMTLLATIIDSVFAISLLIFACAHIWMAGRNQTSIEGASYAHVYRLTPYVRNIEIVFGTNRLYWFLPLYGDGPAGDGVHWERCDGTWDGLAEEDIDEDVENGIVSEEINEEGKAFLPESARGVTGLELSKIE